jgi:nanoRNase/pAp phosphatase (c-di-AMP/oligoRNAs hydrolase)
LIQTGISINEIYLKMYEKKIDDLKVTAYILNHFSVSPHGIAYYLLPADVQTDLKITSEQGKDNVNLFANIAGINAWCSITEDPNPKEWCWRISIRSKKVDISPMKWGGGGDDQMGRRRPHAQASGAKPGGSRIDCLTPLRLPTSSIVPSSPDRSRHPELFAS